MFVLCKILRTASDATMRKTVSTVFIPRLLFPHGFPSHEGFGFSVSRNELMKFSCLMYHGFLKTLLANNQETNTHKGKNAGLSANVNVAKNMFIAAL